MSLAQRGAAIIAIITAPSSTTQIYAGVAIRRTRAKARPNLPPRGGVGGGLLSLPTNFCKSTNFNKRTKALMTSDPSPLCFRFGNKIKNKNKNGADFGYLYCCSPQIPIWNVSFDSCSGTTTIIGTWVIKSAPLSRLN